MFNRKCVKNVNAMECLAHVQWKHVGCDYQTFESLATIWKIVSTMHLAFKLVTVCIVQTITQLISITITGLHIILHQITFYRIRIVGTVADEGTTSKFLIFTNLYSWLHYVSNDYVIWLYYYYHHTNSFVLFTFPLL